MPRNPPGAARAKGKAAAHLAPIAAPIDPRQRVRDAADDVVGVLLDVLRHAPDPKDQLAAAKELRAILALKAPLAPPPLPADPAGEVERALYEQAMAGDVGAQTVLLRARSQLYRPVTGDTAGDTDGRDAEVVDWAPRVLAAPVGVVE